MNDRFGIISNDHELRITALLGTEAGTHYMPIPGDDINVANGFTYSKRVFSLSTVLRFPQIAVECCFQRLAKLSAASASCQPTRILLPEYAWQLRLSVPSHLPMEVEGPGTSLLNPSS